MLVILNPRARGGRGLDDWREIAPKVATLVGPFDTLQRRDAEMVRAAIAERLAHGETRFVAAGGDGTVNLVASSLIEHAPASLRARLVLGAIGLGSSNDFHKPLSGAAPLAGIPCRLDFAAGLQHDVGRLDYETPSGERRRRFWMLNASVGVTAEANLRFNAPNQTLRRLKRVWPAGAIAYAAVRGILGHRAVPLTLAIDDAAPVSVRPRNLGIVKNPHFTGVLRYDSPHEPGSGWLHVHLLEDVSLARLALRLLGLARGRFTGTRGTRSWRAARVVLEALHPFVIETDGEVVAVRRAAFSLLPQALRVCA